MSIRQKLIGGYLVVVLLVAITGVVTWRVDVASARQAAVTEAVQVARTIGKDVAYGLAADTAGEQVVPLYQNSTALSNYLLRLHELQGRDIVVVGRDQRILGDAVPQNIGTVFEEDRADEVGATIRDRGNRIFVETSEDYPDGIKQVVVPLIGAGDAVLGAVILEYTPLYDEMMAVTRQTQQVIIAADIVCIVVVLLLGLLIARSVTRRIGVLTVAVENVRHGDYSGRVTAAGRDEINQLGHAFNGMAEQLERSAREILAKEYTDSILANAGEGICGVDANNRITFANAAAGRITGLGIDGLVGQDAPAVLPDAALPAEGEPAQPGSATREGLLTRPDGSTARVAYTVSSIIKGLRRIGAVIVLHDVSRQRTLERDLRHQALHDGLTGLPNRRLFLDRLEHAMVRAATTGEQISMLFLDLDGFKRVNDSLGHNAGDLLLQAAAERLRGVLRPNDTVARFGGDEFAVLLEPADDTAVEELATHCLDVLSRPFSIQGRVVSVSASIGAVRDARQYTDADEVVRNADVAMYAAKDEGKACYRIFEVGMHDRLLERLDTEARLRVATRHEELRLYLQPVVDVPRLRVCGVEALVRWQDPRRGLQQPAAFVPLAEEIGVIAEIDGWVLRAACRAVKDWQDSDPGNAPQWVSVNLSAAQLEIHDLPQQVRAALAETGLSADALVLELTETTLMRDIALATARLEQLRDLGVRIAIDDFGTGYSSLGYLRDIPIDVLKIDRSFIAGLVRSPRHKDLVSAVVQLGHTLGLRVIAEGVEDEGQLADLADIGCEYVQGYHLGRPQPAADLVERIRTGAPAGV